MVLVGIAVQAVVGGRAEGAALTFGYASIIALAVHSLLDGVIYAASFQEEAFTGWFATGGLLFHEFPEGVIAFFLLYQAGVGRLRSVILALIAAGATTVAGTVGANMLLDLTGGLPLAAMLGGAAGGLIYVLNCSSRTACGEGAGQARLSDCKFRGTGGNSRRHHEHAGG